MKMEIRKITIIAMLALLAVAPSYGQARRGTAAKGKARSGAVARVSAALVKQFNNMVKDHVFFNYEGANGEKCVIAMKPANAQGVGTLVISVGELSNRKSCKYTLLSNGDFYWWDGKQKSRCYLNAQPEGFIVEKMFFQYEASPEEYEELVTPLDRKREVYTDETSHQEAVRAQTESSAAAEKAEDKVYVVAEQMPEFPGGSSSMMGWLAQHINYPTAAAENGVQGRVVVEFIIETDGSLSDIKVNRGVDPSLDKEAVRVVGNMPKWIPGKQNGKPVRVRYLVPVIFRLQ